MLLRSLEMQGFKTFPDKTVLDFEKGITAVVGPNGSGKSNISDAIRWVLGEQSTKTLRCSKMEDVIFGGSSSRSPLSYAQVTLNIDNTDRALNFDADEVSVSRRYYRSGESEYLVNKASVRLKDVNELFMDTGLGRDGYSMIGQGKIDSIVAARSEERREIFDEAAGISRYRYRKEESERRLLKAEENLVRLRDIIGELESRVEPLRIQCEKAEKFIKYSEEKKVLEISLWLDTLNRFTSLMREQEQKVNIATVQYENIEEELSKTESEIEESFNKINEYSALIEEQRASSAKEEENAARKDGEVSVLENEIKHSLENLDRINNEISLSSESEEEMDAQILEKTLQTEEKTKIYNDKNSEYIEYTQKLDDIRKGMDEFSSKIEEFAIRLAKLTAALSESKVKVGSAQSSAEEILIRTAESNEQIKTWTEKINGFEEAVLMYKDLIEKSENRINAAKNMVSGHELRLESRKKKALEAKQNSDKAELDTREQERRAKMLEDLEKNMEGFQYSVKAVMQESAHGTLKGIRGPVSRLIKVPQEYSVAIETALGASLQNIVTDTEDDVKKAIVFLKGKNAGRATFLPISVIKGNVLAERDLAKTDGFIGIASELCSCDSIYNEIKNHLLGRIAVSQDFDSAVLIARKFGYKFRVVTLDGQVVNAGGSMTGGSTAKNAGLLSRASEIERIKNKAADMRVLAEKAVAALKNANIEVSTEEALLSDANAELYAAQDENFRLITEQKHIISEKQTAEESLKSTQDSLKNSADRLKTLAENKRIAETEAENINDQIKLTENEIEKFNVNKDELTEKSSTITDKLQQIRFTALEAQKDADALKISIDEIKKRKEIGKNKKEELINQITEIEEKNQALRTQIDEEKNSAVLQRQNAAALREAAENTIKLRTAAEEKTSKLRAFERTKSSEKENVGHELAVLTERKNNMQTEYDGIISQLWEEYELTRREADNIAQPIENIAETKKALAKLKSRIKELGTVNVSAVEEYKEVSERYTFLTDQVKDIEKSKEELNKLISSIMGKMKELFTERFELIAKNFESIFKELFGGGKASLSLSTPDDILNSGIEISVQPPGKIVTNIELLSGGEKSLVAICIYFAIMKVSPPPFCVLDEIEAALDEVNVTKFANYLRKINDHTQFIVITHRRGSMEEADVLYGVTMQSEGLSKLLTLHPFEVEEKLNIKNA